MREKNFILRGCLLTLLFMFSLGTVQAIDHEPWVSHDDVPDQMPHQDLYQKALGSVHLKFGFN